MAQIVITIPDAQVARVVTAVCAHGRYQPTLPDGSENPQTPGDFVKAQIIAYLRGVTVRYEAEEARRTNDIAIT